MWSNSTEVDHEAVPASAIGPRSPRVRADVLGRELGTVEVDTLRNHHLALAMAVIELAADADQPFPWSHDDPTVALLRALAKLSLTVPDATSSAAADLVERIKAETSGGA